MNIDCSAGMVRASPRWCRAAAQRFNMCLWAAYDPAGRLPQLLQEAGKPVIAVMWHRLTAQGVRRPINCVFDATKLRDTAPCFAKTIEKSSLPKTGLVVIIAVAGTDGEKRGAYAIGTGRAHHVPISSCCRAIQSLATPALVPEFARNAFKRGLWRAVQAALLRLAGVTADVGALHRASSTRRWRLGRDVRDGSARRGFLIERPVQCLERTAAGVDSAVRVFHADNVPLKGADGGGGLGTDYSIGCERFDSRESARHNELVEEVLNCHDIANAVGAGRTDAVCECDRARRCPNLVLLAVSVTARKQSDLRHSLVDRPSVAGSHTMPCRGKSATLAGTQVTAECDRRTVPEPDSAGASEVVAVGSSNSPK